MQSRTIANIKYIDASQLFSWMKNSTNLSFQVIDVRGSDYIGGHIRGGWNYPYKILEDSIPELLNRLHNKRDSDVINVIFHCARSQQRGPSAAMKFLRMIPEPDQDKFEICVLRGGFNYWQDVYGMDPTVTEGYLPELWDR